ncbi:MAG: DUF6382 domain-containing protein [Paenibacillus sp.]|uniref:DUF6382 domain-containing protein n=1 Tax=Paenibacillus sp. TaxID=58172 RepID=UPI002901E4BE|nr:DUF6382 domain-containing protein [Paenibacillus sp.]MDU2241291.1 DUF6382 domain-containing protein [Paenibacillus sp.]
MPELVADFVRDGGTYMILEAKEGLRPEHLNRVQRSMLAAVPVPNLLRLDIREIDYRISLYYDITGKRMLSQCLRSDKIGMPEFYGLLLQVVAVLEDSKRYMLSPSGFLLDETHIFVEEPLSNGSLYFTYVPWREASAVPPLSQTLLSLITRLLTCVARVEGEGIPQLVRLCGDELFSLGELKKILLRLLSNEPIIMPEDDAAVAGGTPSPSPRLAEPSLPSSRSVVVKEYLPLREPTEPGAWAGVADDVADPTVNREEWPGLSEEKAPRETPVKPTYLVLGFLLVDALVWKLLYFDRPGTVGLLLGVAATMLLAVAGFALWRKFRGSSADLEDEDGTFPVSEGTVRPIGISGLLGLSPERVERPGGRKTSPAPLTDGTPWETFAPRTEISYAGLEAAASSEPEVNPHPEPEAMASPPTVLLNRSMLQGQDQPLSGRAPRYYLERYESAGGVPEKIPLASGSFVIGRSEEIAQYVEHTTGVSRAHVEILITSRGCRLKDLGSKNGTRLNGESVAPYKEYPLQADDVFILAETSFRFGEEVS